MNATYWQKGEILDYTNSGSTTLAAGLVIGLTSRIGVLGTSLAAGETGPLHVSGVFVMPKEASLAISAGASVYYDAENDCITTTSAGNTPAGWCPEAAAAADDDVKVNIGCQDGAAAGAAAGATAGATAGTTAGTTAGAAEFAKTHDSLALKDTNNVVYDITVNTSGVLTATVRT